MLPTKLNSDHYLVSPSDVAWLHNGVQSYCLLSCQLANTPGGIRGSGLGAVYAYWVIIRVSKLV